MLEALRFAGREIFKRPMFLSGGSKVPGDVSGTSGDVLCLMADALLCWWAVPIARTIVLACQSVSALTRYTTQAASA
jgi:hypothetical protein